MFAIYRLRNVAEEQVTDVSLVLKDSDPQFVDPAFCIRWPENRQF